MGSHSSYIYKGARRMTTVSLVECFSVIRDPRQESKIDHELIDILVLCVLAVICGAEGWQDIEEV